MAKKVPNAGVHIAMARAAIDLALASNLAMLADGNIAILALLPGCSATKCAMADEKLHVGGSFHDVFEELKAVLFQNNRQEKLYF